MSKAKQNGADASGRAQCQNMLRRRTHCVTFSVANKMDISFDSFMLSVRIGGSGGAVAAAAEHCTSLMRIFQYFIRLLNENSLSYSSEPCLVWWW